MTALLPVASRRPGGAEASVREVGGQTVVWFRMSGPLGEREAATVARAVRTANDIGVPVLGVLDAMAPDVSGGVGGLAGLGEVAAAMARASGAVPQALVVSGQCWSPVTLLLGLADVVVATVDAVAVVSGPAAVAQVTGHPITAAALGGAGVLSHRNGVVALVAPDEAAAVDDALAVLSYLAPNAMAEPAVHDEADTADRDCSVAVPRSPTAGYDVREVAADVVDIGSWLELGPCDATSLVTALATVEGRPVGVVANQPCQRAGTINIAAAQKGARFVQLCDAFNVPLLTLVDTPGFQPGKELEWRGMIRHGAQLVHAYARATVPRVCVVLRKAYGGAYIVMDSKGMGNDACVAWPGAEMAVMGAAGAVGILHRGVEGAARAELEADYAARHCTTAIAAERGYIDDIIEPADTRRVIALALRALRFKREKLPERRHSLMPL